MSVLGRPFSFYLKSKRKQFGMSQAELADKSKVERTSISRLESHASNPQWNIIQRLSEDGMGIPVAEFFQVEPLEAKQPLIQIEGASPAPRMAEIMLKTQGKLVPIITNPSPLRTKVVTDSDISGYIVIDHGMLTESERLAPLVAWPAQATNRGAAGWVLVDVAACVIKNGDLILVELDDKIQVRRSWISPKGALILDGYDDEKLQPVAFWGRQRERVECLGRVIMTAVSHRTVVSP